MANLHLRRSASNVDSEQHSAITIDHCEVVGSCDTVAVPVEAKVTENTPNTVEEQGSITMCGLEWQYFRLFFPCRLCLLLYRVIFVRKGPNESTFNWRPTGYGEA